MDGLFDTIAGLPMHPLLVHAPVVLLPLGALGLLLVLVRRAWRERYGFLVGAALVAGAGAAFVAAESGEALAKRVGVPVDHSTWGERLPIAAGALAVVALGWLLSTRRSAQSGLAKGLGALAAVLAVAVVALTALVGHSGASAAWKDRRPPAPPPVPPRPQHPRVARRRAPRHTAWRRSRSTPRRSHAGPPSTARSTT